MVILGDCGVKKKVSKTSIFELPKVKNCISRLCTNPLGPPPPPGPNSQIGLKTRKYGLKHALHSLVILGDHDIKKTTLENFDF